MQNILKYLMIALAAAIFVGESFAADMDNGTDANGRMVVSEVLARRCSLSSKKPEMTEDCFKRMAYDYKSNEPIGYDSFSAERRAILNDYAAAYFLTSINEMIASGKYEDQIDELIGKDPTASVSLDNDAREDIEFNNKLASNNSSRLLFAVNSRASAINMDNIANVLDRLVPAIDVDTADTSLAKPPSE